VSRCCPVLSGHAPPGLSRGLSARVARAFSRRPRLARGGGRPGPPLRAVRTERPLPRPYAGPFGVPAQALRRHPCASEREGEAPAGAIRGEEGAPLGVDINPQDRGRKFSGAILAPLRGIHGPGRLLLSTGCPARKWVGCNKVCECRTLPDARHSSTVGSHTCCILRAI
jgi:hypothetical protein